MTAEKLSRILRGKTVLITGGGGTIGSEIARQMAGRNSVRIVCLGKREDNLVPIRDELGQHSPDLYLETEVCDVRERARLSTVFSKYRPSIVFHAAAEKDIRDAEARPARAVMVNVQGTVNVVDMALANGSEKLVFTSSTKASSPLSVMGATKLLGETIVRAASMQSGRAFFTVRLSNVLDSGGGVHSLFRRQIESGRPVTVTHPDAERTFVTAAETASLLLDTLCLGSKGDILALSAGEKTSILHLAQRLIRSYGLKEGRDIDIEFIGLRNGERLLEDTDFDGNNWLPTAHEKILVSCVDGVSAPSSGFNNSIRELLLVADMGDVGAVLDKLRKMVPSLNLGSVDEL